MAFLKQNWFKIFAGVILLLAMGHHPYSYFQFTRWVVVLSAGYSAYLYSELKKPGWMWIFIAVAILFNPIFPFYMSADTWHGYDLVAAIIFLVSSFRQLRK